MDLSELINKANDINQLTIDNNLSDVMEKEIKKIEMYVRKTYIMLREYETYTEEGTDDDEFLTRLNVRLVRDQKYVKARDSLDTYVL